MSDFTEFNVVTGETTTREFTESERADIAAINLVPVGLLWESMRFDRDALLAASDWTQLPDSPLGALEQQRWAQYRQELRDLPERTADPSLITWPLPPE